MSSLRVRRLNATDKKLLSCDPVPDSRENGFEGSKGAEQRTGTLRRADGFLQPHDGTSHAGRTAFMPFSAHRDKRL